MTIHMTNYLWEIKWNSWVTLKKTDFCVCVCVVAVLICWAVGRPSDFYINVHIKSNLWCETCGWSDSWLCVIVCQDSKRGKWTRHFSLNVEKETLVHNHHPKNNCRPAAVVYLADISSLVKCLLVHRLQGLDHTRQVHQFAGQRDAIYSDYTMTTISYKWHRRQQHHYYQFTNKAFKVFLSWDYLTASCDTSLR